MSHRCYLYWAHLPEHTDITSEGYVGISVNPEIRFKQHKSNCTSRQHRYNRHFKESLKVNTVVLDILLVASVSYCKDLERKLRPQPNIGWNLAIGGDGGMPVHGLTGTRSQKHYHNMLTRAKQAGKSVCKEWQPPEGLVAFTDFINKLEGDGEISLKDQNGDYEPGNMGRISRRDLCRKAAANYTIDDSNRKYSIVELAERYELKPNTISSRLRNGWTIREAVGLDERILGIKLQDGSFYKGSLTEEDLCNIAELYQQGVSIRDIAKQLGKVKESCICRLIHRMEK